MSDQGGGIGVPGEPERAVDVGWGGEPPPPAETFEDWTEVDVLRAIGRELQTQTRRLDSMYVCLWILAALAVLNVIGAFLWIFGVVTIDVGTSNRF